MHHAVAIALLQVLFIQGQLTFSSIFHNSSILAESRLDNLLTNINFFLGISKISDNHEAVWSVFFKIFFKNTRCFL